MKPIIFTFLAIITLSNCSTDNSSKETQDTLTQINDDDELSPEIDYSMIEQYAILDCKEKLEIIFGEDNLKNGFSYYAEGTVKLPHTILTNPKNGHVVKYVWTESNPNELGSVEVSFILWNEDYENTGSQKIGSECGIYTGMPLKDLKTWNGKDFMFSGFGWDYAGGIYAQPDTKIYDCKVNIRLDLDFENNFEEYEFLLGDVELSTKDGIVLNAPITVAELIIYL